ncbi:hypothetical protein KAW53_07150 [Candidatus Bathyarchaeota archaeon]|nr:hypothetical protein [Candidatus Bathyarchaeota archaeon]
MGDEAKVEDEVRALNAVNPDTGARLEEELERFKTVSKQGLELRLTWQPREEGSLSGEVKGKTIYIYEQEEGKALETLTHEFIDYLVNLAIEPYKTVVNSLIKSINRIAYEQKEKVVESLRALLESERD